MVPAGGQYSTTMDTPQSQTAVRSDEAAAPRVEAPGPAWRSRKGEAIFKFALWILEEDGGIMSTGKHLLNITIMAS
jgi:hypothetical protein